MREPEWKRRDARENIPHRDSHVVEWKTARDAEERKEKEKVSNELDSIELVVLSAHLHRQTLSFSLGSLSW